MITPHGTVGHSSGEIATAYCAGRISRAEAIVIAYCRGKAMLENKQDGAMLAVGLSTHEALLCIEKNESIHIQITAISSPSSVTLSGDADSIGTLHSRLQAVTYADAVFETSTYEQWTAGLSAKVTGSINLQEVSVEQTLALDLFIMTSSSQAIMAVPGQATYCAANNFQDALARKRKYIGLPACSIGISIITEIIKAGSLSKALNEQHRRQTYTIGELSLIELIEAAFMKAPESVDSWYPFDTLAMAQVMTCLEPSKLASL